MKLYVSEPSERHAGPILVHDEDHNDIAEFYHNEHATVGQSYETALALAHKLVTGDEPQPMPVRALDWQETFTDRGDGSSDHTGWEALSGFGPFYEIDQYLGSDSYGWQVRYDMERIGDFDDPDQAKACAQEHFAEHVTAALSRPDGERGAS